VGDAQEKDIALKGGEVEGGAEVVEADGVTTPSATTRRVGLRLIHGKKDRSRIVNKTDL
jgi:hypothetical protein